MHLKTIIFVAGIASGIIVGELSAFATEIVITTSILALLQCAVVYGARRKNTSSLVALYTLIFAIGISLGSVRMQMYEEQGRYVCEEVCTFDAKIISSPTSKDSSQVFSVHPIDAPESILDVRVRTALFPTYHVGETLRLSGKVLEPKVLPPHGEKMSFDYPAYLQTKHVGSEMTYPHIEVIDSDAHSFPEHLGRWKEEMIVAIEQYVSSPASSLANGMLFGNATMSTELSQIFRTAGLSHIVVLSGFNIAVIISFVLFVCAFLPLYIRAGVACIVVALFLVMVGGEASVVRASLMAGIALFATVLGKEYMARQALIISLLLIVMYDPYALLHDVSLHLSFLATAGLVYVSAPLTTLFERYISHSILPLVTTTLAAYFATLPYIMFMFGSISVYALVANIVVLPFVPIAMLMSFVVLVASYISSTLALIAGVIDGVIITCMIRIAEAIVGLPFASLTVHSSLIQMITLYITGAGVLIYFMKKSKNETLITNDQDIISGIISY